MSPEQTLGKPIDHRTDIWSMGVMMYQMLTGRLPFPGEYEQVIRYSVLSEEPEPLRPLCPDASPELERIVLKAMGKDPDDRYQTAAELLADLRAERAKARPADTGAGFDNTVTLEKRQRRLTTIVVALSLLLLVALGVIVWLALQ
jgi:serine/threonine-protein kinase